LIRVACHDALVELSPKEDARTSDIASRGSTALRHWIEMSRVARVSRWSYRACHTSSTLDTSVSVVDGDKAMYPRRQRNMYHATGVSSDKGRASESCIYSFALAVYVVSSAKVSLAFYDLP